MIDENGETVQIEVDENTRAQVLATRELTKMLGKILAASRVGK